MWAPALTVGCQTPDFRGWAEVRLPMAHFAPAGRPGGNPARHGPQETTQGRRRQRREDSMDMEWSRLAMGFGPAVLVVLAIYFL